MSANPYTVYHVPQTCPSNIGSDVSSCLTGQTNLLVEGIQYEFDQVIEVWDLVWVLWRRLPQTTPLALWGEEVQLGAGELEDEAHANGALERCFGELTFAALKKHLCVCREALGFGAHGLGVWAQ